MAAAQLILSVDYEVFGDGSGEPRRCVQDPARRIMQVAEGFDAPVTLFVDAAGFAMMESELRSVCSVAAIKAQLAAALERGHDLQLHLHPQWEGGRMDAEGEWQLDLSRWRIADLSDGEIRVLLKEGRTWLEDLARSRQPDYRCIAFRAGGWCIQPSERVVRALRKLDFLIDSSVAPGMRNTTKGEWLDFTKAPKLPYWMTRGDVCTPEKKGLYEMPIATARIDPVRHMRALVAVKGRPDAGFASGCEGSYRGPGGTVSGVVGRLAKLSKLGQVMLDFSSMPSRVLIDVSRKWLKQFDGVTDVPLPLVAIGHTKNFSAASEQALAEYLEWASGEGIAFTTFPAWLDALNAD
ncbi:hypothetical protein [Candidatus Endoriftia persephone]|jgi:hypothetical protein|uniref:Polysaccharide deacetylase n=3 Tax=Gammaproteobacteria TaxID=1236 RepID=G2FDV1_9GAMM|nr:hypothetical protein [Candidatus Endoriftia persephone]EGW54935.1 hypothetical protein TevJSym_ag00130 [endosymbiont of Tevnia jerichonana (vent Tica)]USF87909.1 hypothetical protein L0Y14_01265 [Candidatus Endoriftia persephone]